MKTKTDMRLAELFGSRYMVFCNQVLAGLPAGTTVGRVGEPGMRAQVASALPKEAGCLLDRWEHVLITDSNDSYHVICAMLAGNRQLSDRRVGERPGFLAALVNRPGSLVYSAAWAGVYSILGALVLSLLK